MIAKDKLITMARKAGGADITCNGWTSWVGTQSTEFLERFANIVATEECEACAKLVLEMQTPFANNAPDTAIAIIARITE